MNYKKVYEALCQNAKTRKPPKGYVEKHHILPSSLGGSDDTENLVSLTPREHFVAHRILARLTNDPKMWMALNFMINNRFMFGKPKCAPGDSKNYEKDRLICATNFTGSNNPMFGKARPDLIEYNKTRVNPLKGKSGGLSKTSKPLCVEFLNGDIVFTEVGAEQFARQNGIPTGTLSFCLSTGYGAEKHNIKKAWRP
jgi:hypothetical protein